jgi:hypothetical protein
MATRCRLDFNSHILDGDVLHPLVLGTATRLLGELLRPLRLRFVD